MKNLEELIQLRKSNKFHNIGVNVESVIEVVKNPTIILRNIAFLLPELYMV